MDYYKAEEVIDELRKALDNNDILTMRKLVTADESSLIINWENEPDYIVDEWTDLFEEAKNIIE